MKCNSGKIEDKDEIVSDKKKEMKQKRLKFEYGPYM